MNTTTLGYFVIALFVSIAVNRAIAFIEKLYKKWKDTSGNDVRPSPPLLTDPLRSSPPSLTDPPVSNARIGSTNNQVKRRRTPPPIPTTSAQRGIKQSILDYPTCPVCWNKNRQGQQQKIFKEPNNRWRCIDNHYFAS